jgi:hypothetical protein
LRRNVKKGRAEMQFAVYILHFTQGLSLCPIIPPGLQPEDVVKMIPVE